MSTEQLLAALLKVAEARRDRLAVVLKTTVFTGNADYMAQALRTQVMHDLCEVLREAMKEKS